MKQGRIALYFAPLRKSLLERIGRAWFAGKSAADRCGLDALQWNELTRKARHYGFHATLKPPFVLHDGATLQDIGRALAAFSARQKPFYLPGLTVREMIGFVALRTAAPSPDMDGLAAACVREFDHFRKPPSHEELARRRAVGLTPEEEAHLVRWGYPYVLDAFRFHMTLTGRIRDPQERSQVLTRLRNAFAPMEILRIPVRELCLFVQPSADMPFLLRARYRFGGEERQTPSARPSLAL